MNEIAVGVADSSEPLEEEEEENGAEKFDASKNFTQGFSGRVDMEDGLIQDTVDVGHLDVTGQEGVGVLEDENLGHMEQEGSGREETGHDDVGLKEDMNLRHTEEEHSRHEETGHEDVGHNRRKRNERHSGRGISGHVRKEGKRRKDSGHLKQNDSGHIGQKDSVSGHTGKRGKDSGHIKRKDSGRTENSGHTDSIERPGLKTTGHTRQKDSGRIGRKGHEESGHSSSEHTELKTGHTRQKDSGRRHGESGHSISEHVDTGHKKQKDSRQMGKRRHEESGHKMGHRQEELGHSSRAEIQESQDLMKSDILGQSDEEVIIESVRTRSGFSQPKPNRKSSADSAEDIDDIIITSLPAVSTPPLLGRKRKHLATTKQGHGKVQ